MKRLKFEYRTIATFDKNVTDQSFCLRCIPKEEERQHLEWYKIEIHPDVFVQVDQDYWGNKTVEGFIIDPHDHFEFRCYGEVTVDLSRPRKSWNPIFKYSTKFTQASPEMKQFSEILLEDKENENSLSKALYLMNGLYKVFEYKKNVTDILTTAAQAFMLGQGVCQDYAHMLTAMCLCMNIPARYVAGFMLGEGHTHAWTEIFSDGSWYGLDPTNNLMVDETYIKVAHGRNAMDCSVIRGVFKGFAKESQSIYVNVEG